MNRRRHRHLGLVILFCAAAWPTVTRAEDIDQLYDQGQAAFEKENYQEAHAKLSAVWASRKSYDVATVLAQTEMRLGRHRDAAEHLAYAVAHFPVSAKMDLRKQIEAMFAEARANVGMVRIHVKPAIASVRVAGREWGPEGHNGPIFVDPGKVTIEVSAAGYRPTRRVLDVAKGTEAEATIVLMAEQVPERSRVPAYVMGGVGVASLVAGGILLGSGFAKKAEAYAIRDDSGQCTKAASGPELHMRCEEMRGIAHAADVLGNTGIGLLAVGAAAVVGAGVYWMWPNPVARPAKASSQLVPAVGAAGGGLVWIGSF